MSDEKHVSASGSISGSTSAGCNAAGSNLALAENPPSIDECGPFELSTSRSETKPARDGKPRDGDFSDERNRGSKSRSRTSRRGGTGTPSHTGIPSHTEEYYLSAALAEEGSRPSLAFVFPPLARAIEEAAREARSQPDSLRTDALATRSRKPFGRAHLHVVEGRAAEESERSAVGRFPNQTALNQKGLSQLGRDPFEIEPPDRNYDCRNYDTCLGLAAALNWNSFACTGCSGSVNQHLLWRAHSEVRKNRTLAELCDLPNIVADSASETLIEPNDLELTESDSAEFEV